MQHRFIISIELQLCKFDVTSFHNSRFVNLILFLTQITIGAHFRTLSIETAIISKETKVEVASDFRKH